MMELANKNEKDDVCKRRKESCEDQIDHISNERKRAEALRLLHRSPLWIALKRLG